MVPRGLGYINTYFCVDEGGIKEVAYFILGVAMGQRLSSPRFG